MTAGHGGFIVKRGFVRGQQVVHAHFLSVVRHRSGNPKIRFIPEGNHPIGFVGRISTFRFVFIFRRLKGMITKRTSCL